MSDPAHRSQEGDAADPQRAISSSGAGSSLPLEDSEGVRHRDRTRRRHAVVRVILLTVAGLVIATGLAAVYGYRHLNGNIEHVDIDGQRTVEQPEHVVPTGPDGPRNILVMSYDGRDCKGCAIDGETGAGGSDTTILIHLSGDRQHAYGISIPRDSLVTRPDCKDEDGDIRAGGTDQMWNAAYAVGGIACTVQQFEQTTQIPVDDWVVVNFASFKSMIDAIGGVEVCIPETVDDPAHDVYLAAGTRKISGNEALTYMRARYQIGNGSDIDRTRRQQAFISAMISQVMSSSTLTNPVKVAKFLNAATKSLTTDPGFDVNDMAGLAWQLRSIGRDHIQFFTIPNEYVGARVVWVDPATEIWGRLLHD